MGSVLLRFGAPPDPVAWCALLLAAASLALALRPPRLLLEALERAGTRHAFALAIVAALLSAGYVAYYLRGGPRIIDATSYYLEARALAGGDLAFDVPWPSGSFRGRFLLPSDDGSLGVIFPPGYPAFLSLGFRLGAPLALGPLVAALLVLGTHTLALRLFESPRLALLAALLSALCVALRYHTADTMSHGLGALLWLAAVLAALKGRAWLWLAGLLAGWMIATRPITGLAASISILFAARPAGWRAPVALAIGALPGVALLFAHQHAVTGSWLGSTQLAYYAVADGPPGCFRYGFGAGVGCGFEHGDFVNARLAHGFGFLEALGTTARRLHHHLLDVANAEPLALLVPVAFVLGRTQRGVRLLSLSVLLIVLAHVPFYFDATYPGGGARVYAEALPFEHVLVAWCLERLRIARFAPAIALGGFALHASFSHRALSEREGGRPMFEPSVLERAGVQRGLVFVTTDHGFNLGHRPEARDLVVARLRSDAHDWWLHEALGRPPAYRYVYDPWSPGSSATLEPYLPPRSARFEAEAEWPPFSVRGGWAHPDFPGADCRSGTAALRLVPSGSTAVTVTLEAIAPAEGPHRVVAGWLDRERCWETEVSRGPLARGPNRVVITTQSAGWLDYVEVRAISGQSASMPRAPKKR